jgi:uncharacterized membrane protein YjjP (DUF1212 family)
MVPTFRAAAGLLTLVTILAVALVLIRSADAAVDIARPPALLAKTTPSAAELTNSSAGRQSTIGSSVNSSAEGSSSAGALSASNPAGSASTALTTDGTSASREATNSTSTNPSSTEPSSIESNTSSSSPNPARTSVGATVAPATPPAAAQSEIGRGTLLIAIGVLVIATAMMILALVLTLNRRRPRTATAAAREATGRGPPIPIVPVSTEHQDGWSSPVDGSSLTDVMAMLVELGDTMIDSGDPVTHVRDTLQRLAEINGIAAPEIIVLPTALIITLPGMEEMRTEVASTGESTLRLDQVEAIFTVADAAERGEIGPRVALVEIRSARNLPPSFGPAVIMGGHAVIAMGLALILSGGWTEVGVAAVLGAGVGVIKQWAARRPLAVQVFLPFSCAFLVAVAVSLLARTELDPAVLPPILGALVTFIPGGLLTTAVIELATGQMISGASRFVYGSLQLVLLSLGIVGGLQLVGIPAITVAESDSSLIGAVVPWIGVLVFGLGVLLSYSGRPGSFGWMLLVLYVAYAGQVVGGLLFGSSLSAFVGAAVMTPFAVFVAAQRSGPPTLVTFLPAFWLLVPGAIALVGVTQVMGEATVDGVSAILGAGVTIVSIALGVVLGLSVGQWAMNWIRKQHRSRVSR